MTKNHLDKILKCAFGDLYTVAFFNRLYEPEYYSQPIDEDKLNRYAKNLLAFDYKAFEFEFVSGSISCTGVEITFKSNRFDRINVQVFYDLDTKKCYNGVLAIPRYTKNDWIGRKSINQKGRDIRSDKQLRKYIERQYSLFDCPILTD